jgi:peptidoglycan/xylan/chitin deacetylase (PgdA/CDA1 family)
LRESSVRAILTYHSIDDSGSPISTAPAVFARHAAWLRSGRVRVTSIPELVALPDQTDAVAITFDDGFANFREAAARLEGLPVTLFVVTDHVGRTNAWRGVEAAGVPTLPLLDWTELATLAERGVTLGAHTLTHPDLRVLTQTQCQRELNGSAQRLHAETGQAIDTVAYPYGAVSAAVSAAAATVFRWGCTTDLRPLESAERALELPRLDMYYFRDMGRLEAWGTRSFAARLACRRALRHGRRLVREQFQRDASGSGA